MSKLFETIYSIFKPLYGRGLSSYLAGYDCSKQSFSGENLYMAFGIITFTIAIIVAFLYYYLPLKGFNHPRTNRWWNWAIMLSLSGLINYLIASNWLLNNLEKGLIGNCLPNISESSCRLFALANFLVSSLVFTITSFIIKFKSRNCKFSPF